MGMFLYTILEVYVHVGGCDEYLSHVVKRFDGRPLLSYSPKCPSIAVIAKQYRENIEVSRALLLFYIHDIQILHRKKCVAHKTRYRKTCLKLASSPGFSLLPRNNLRMTFDPPERKAEGEPGPFSHVIDDT